MVFEKGQYVKLKGTGRVARVLGRERGLSVPSHSAPWYHLEHPPTSTTYPHCTYHYAPEHKLRKISKEEYNKKAVEKLL